MSSDKSFRCRINTPDDTAFEGDVTSLVLPGEEGSFGVLHNHEPYMAVLSPGSIRIDTDDSEKLMACGGGFAEIRENNVTILADTAEFPDELDRDEIESSLEAAKQQLESDEEVLDSHERDELEQKIQRDKVRLNVLEK